MKIKFTNGPRGEVLANDQAIDSCWDVCTMLAENSVEIEIPDGNFWARQLTTNEKALMHKLFGEQECWPKFITNKEEFDVILEKSSEMDSSRLIIVAIMKLTDWKSDKIANMTAHPESVKAGNLCGISSTSAEVLETIFGIYVLPQLGTA